MSDLELPHSSKPQRAAAVTAALKHRYYQNETIYSDIEQQLAAFERFSRMKPRTTQKLTRKVKDEPLSKTEELRTPGKSTGQKKKRQLKKQKESDIYLVERVVGKKVVGRRNMYLVKWEGYTSDQNTWEPQANLANVKHLIKEFNE